jgi:hypothetical protein
MFYTVLCYLIALGRLGLCGTRGTYPRVLHDASEILASGTVGLVTCSFVFGLGGGCTLTPRS